PPWLRFNPRARVGRDPGPTRGPRRRAGRFNPRARVGRDPWQAGKYAGGHVVSLHAPAWGATTCRTGLGRRLAGFHPRAPVGRGPGPTRGPRRRAGRFNPRARVGRDPWQAGKYAGGHVVSIHAPAWGATTCRTGLG